MFMKKINEFNITRKSSCSSPNGSTIKSVDIKDRNRTGRNKKEKIINRRDDNSDENNNKNVTSDSSSIGGGGSNEYKDKYPMLNGRAEIEMVVKSKKNMK